MLSKACIARLERVQVWDVEVVEEWTNCIFVKVRGRRAKFISKRAIEKDFVESRRRRTRVLAVEQLSEGNWRVENLEVGSRYLVTQVQGKYYCTCKDFEKYGAESEGHYCKHIWAVVNQSFGEGEVVMEVSE